MRPVAPSGTAPTDQHREGPYLLFLAAGSLALGAWFVAAGPVGPGVAFIALAPFHLITWVVRRRPGPTPRWARAWRIGDRRRQLGTRDRS